MTHVIKEFHEWREDKGLSSADEHFITDVTMSLSMVKYKDNKTDALSEERLKKLRDNVPKLWERCLNDWANASLPDYEEVTDITFPQYAAIIKSGVEKEFSVEELLYSLYKQGLCAELCKHLLKTADTPQAKAFVNKMEK
ncbi:hypothetical protein FKN04_09940 [Bacillus glycinifermentans]|uniref:hypothetical protein n=1 Tax=Bacillus glycinifermentans TaxID=1664069 RepID=UPI001583CBDB|nr:hypothetical protein [Bacillus glycinifermentans]NUJ16912.1 hypothetical protein [Bacillus glycinifermentans]